MRRLAGISLDGMGCPIQTMESEPYTRLRRMLMVPCLIAALPMALREGRCKPLAGATFPAPYMPGRM